jgi:hypothetical protein
MTDREMTDVYIRIKRPEDYDDVAPEIVVEDFRAGQQRKEVWEWEVVAAEPEVEDPDLAAALGWPGGISDPVLDRKNLLGMVAALRVASAKPEAEPSAEPSELVQAARDAMAALEDMDERSLYGGELICVADEINALRRALVEHEAKGGGR